jgi:hypothetical protein
MVNSKHDAKEAIQSTITYIAGLGYFEDKLNVMNTLLELQWSLRDVEVESEDAEENDIWDDELRGGIESPWCD